MSNFKIKFCELNPKLYKKGEVIFIIEGTSCIKIDNFCARLSHKIGTIVDWYMIAGRYIIKTMERYVQRAIVLGKEILLKEFETNFILYRKNNYFISIYNDYLVISSVVTSYTKDLKKWCQQLSDTMYVAVTFDGTVQIFSKRPVKDFEILKTEKNNCNVECNSFNIFNPFYSFLEDFECLIKHNFKYERIIDCTGYELNTLIESTILEAGYKLVNRKTTKQSQLKRAFNSFESIYMTYYNSATHKWIIIGNINNDNDVLSKLIVI